MMGITDGFKNMSLSLPSLIARPLPEPGYLTQIDPTGINRVLTLTEKSGYTLSEKLGGRHSDSTRQITHKVFHQSDNPLPLTPNRAAQGRDRPVSHFLEHDSVFEDS